MNDIDKRLLEIDDEFKILVQERSKLIDENRDSKYDAINDFLLENLGDIEFEVFNLSRYPDGGVEFRSVSDELDKFIQECIDLYTVDPTSFQTHFHFYVWDDKVQFYAKDKYSKLQISIHDYSILNKFIEEYGITKMSFNKTDEKIEEYELKLKELKQLKNKFE